MSHSIGFGFRFKALSVGMDYNFGSVKSLDAPKTNDSSLNDLYKSRTNHLRFFVGISGSFVSFLSVFLILLLVYYLGISLMHLIALVVFLC
ncbi:MAG: hypothetical protein IIB07_06395 [Bacteroidetes bacterium]|nr:hypothetical protein [Bacteroidota bacterium]